MEDFTRRENIPLWDDHSNATVSRKLVDFEHQVSAIEQGPDEQDRWQGDIVKVAGGRVCHS